MEKKKILAVGLLAGAGVLIASEIGVFGNGEGMAEAIEGKKGGILGTYGGTPQGVPTAAPTIYQIPAAAPVTFPRAPIFDISRIFAPTIPGPTPSPPITPGKVPTEGVLFKGLPIPAHYPEDVVAYAASQYKPEAFIKGLTEEQKNIAYLASHPTLMLSPEGKIVPRPKKVVTPSQLTSGQRTAYEIMSGVAAPLRVTAAPLRVTAAAGDSDIDREPITPAKKVPTGPYAVTKDPTTGKYVRV